MKTIVKLLRVIVMILSFTALIGYYIVTSDVPPTVELNDLYTFVAVYLVVILVAIIDLIICINHRYRGGYFTLCFELVILCLWVLSYHGVNFQIGDMEYVFGIVIGGMISSAIPVLLHLPGLNIMKPVPKAGDGSKS